MEKKNVFVKALTGIGVTLVCFPILAPVLISAIAWAAGGVWRLDYLMPAELVPFALVGGGLLLLAALRVQSRWRNRVGWSLGAAVIALVGAQGFAVFSGLASGEVEPVGWPFGLVLALLAIYLLALTAMAIGGILLAREVFRLP